MEWGNHTAEPHALLVGLLYVSSRGFAAVFNPVRRPPAPGVVSQARNSSEPGQEPSSRRRTPPPLRCEALGGHSGGLYPAFGACPALGPALTSQPRRYPTAPRPQAARGPGTAAPRPVWPRRSRGWREGGGGLGAPGRRPGLPGGGWGRRGKLCGRPRALTAAFPGRSPA